MDILKIRRSPVAKKPIGFIFLTLCFSVNLSLEPFFPHLTSLNDPRKSSLMFQGRHLEESCLSIKLFLGINTLFPNIWCSLDLDMSTDSET